jgi:hypothetical protein
MLMILISWSSSAYSFSTCERPGLAYVIDYCQGLTVLPVSSA